MEIAADVKRNERTIGRKADEAKGITALAFKVNVPAPYFTGHVCTEAEASILNQTLAENISNNLREKLVRGFEVTAPADGKEGTYRPFTQAEAQAEVDKYVASYSPGVRTGGGTPRVTDPIEREALNIAAERVDSFLEGKGLKRKDVDFKAMRAKLFDANREGFMKEAKKVVDARTKATSATDSLTADLMDFLPGVGGDGQQGAGESESEQDEEEEGANA